MYTILVCDDDPDIVSALEIYLGSEGYKTVAAQPDLLDKVQGDVHLRVTKFTWAARGTKRSPPTTERKLYALPRNRRYT